MTIKRNAKTLDAFIVGIVLNINFSLPLRSGFIMLVYIGSVAAAEQNNQSVCCREVTSDLSAYSYLYCEALGKV